MQCDPEFYVIRFRYELGRAGWADAFSATVATKFGFPPHTSRTFLWSCWMPLEGCLRRILRNALGWTNPANSDGSSFATTKLFPSRLAASTRESTRKKVGRSVQRQFCFQTIQSYLSVELPKQGLGMPEYFAGLLSLIGRTHLAYTASKDRCLPEKQLWYDARFYVSAVGITLHFCGDSGLSSRSEGPSFSCGLT
jgi:hypothetical protein